MIGRMEKGIVVFFVAVVILAVIAGAWAWASLANARYVAISSWGEEYNGISCRIRVLKPAEGGTLNIILDVANKAHQPQTVALRSDLRGEYVDHVHLIVYKGKDVLADVTGVIYEQEDSRRKALTINPGNVASRMLRLSVGPDLMLTVGAEVKACLDCVEGAPEDVAITSGGVRLSDIYKVKGRTGPTVASPGTMAGSEAGKKAGNDAADGQKRSD